MNIADKNYYQIKFKEFCVSWNKFHKNLPRDSFKIFFWTNVVLYEIYSKKSKVTNTYVHGQYLVLQYKLNSPFPIVYFYICLCLFFSLSYANFQFFRNISEIVIQIVWKTRRILWILFDSNFCLHSFCFLVLIFPILFYIANLTSENKNCL
jgi:hypothetical protein